MNKDHLYDAFDSEEHRRWKQDRLLRRRIPLHETWRGCLGLAALLANVDSTEYHGDDHALIHNDNVTWLAMRDVPPGHFPSSHTMNRRDVQYVNCARASLRYGMAVIDFTVAARDAWDLRFMPFGLHRRKLSEHGVQQWVACGDVLNSDERPREFAVCNRLSAAMTRHAFTATMSGTGRCIGRGRGTVRPTSPTRRPRARRRHRNGCPERTCRIQRSTRCTS